MISNYCNKSTCENYLRAKSKTNITPYVTSICGDDLIDVINISIECITCKHFKKTDNFKPIIEKT